MITRPVLAITHVPWETPALIEAALGATPIQVRTILDEPDPALPSPGDLGGLIVMGGPQDANDDAHHPGLAAERRLLATCVDADIPVLGVCLGMQLLGLALGGRLHLRHGVELGFLPVELTPAGTADPIFGPFHRAAQTTFLHWHSDAMELPAGAQLLASTQLTPVQAFRLGSALGTQFHPEADSPLLDKWLAEPAMTSALPPEEVARLRHEGETYLPGLRDAALAAFGSFRDAVEARRNG